MKNRCIIITATIVPNSTKTLVIDVDTRINEYIKNLSFYLSVFPDEEIYFIENSGFNIMQNENFKPFQAFPNLHFVSMPKSNNFSKGKGFQEFEMLDKLIAQLQYKYFIKLTGRYKINNIKQLVKAKPKGIIIDQYKKIKTATTNVFYCKTEFYNKHILNQYKFADDSKKKIVEFVIYDALNAVTNQKEIELFPEQIKLTGVSGSYGEEIKKNKWKELIRNFERWITKKLGFNKFLFKY